VLQLTSITGDKTDGIIISLLLFLVNILLAFTGNIGRLQKHFFFAIGLKSKDKLINLGSALINFVFLLNITIIFFLFIL